MAFKHITTVWTLTQAMRLAWATIRAGQRLERSGVRLEARLDGIATAQGVDMLDVLEPLGVV